MDTKVGRNKPCPCGSGKKYKKCCLRIEESFNDSEVLDYIDEKGRLTGRPSIKINFQDKKYRAVKNRIHIRPPNETFHEFILFLLWFTLNPDWVKKESTKPNKQRHILINWLAEFRKIPQSKDIRIEDKEKGIKSAQMTGNLLALLCLAYDIYTILHCADLPEELLERLKNNKQFQGAKYEIAVAGIFARAGFNISWIKRTSRPTCEFLAIHKKTKEKILVEAKSRHREGILGVKGVKISNKKLKSKMFRLYKRALSKAPPKLPFVIFLDLNLPPTPKLKPFDKKWFRELGQMINKFDKIKPQKSNEATIVVITNFSWYYLGSKKTKNKPESLIILHNNPKNSLQNIETFTNLKTGTEQYGLIPPEI